MESNLRKVLIESCHSSEEADKYMMSILNSEDIVEQLVNIALDKNEIGGDAPMQAAYYLSQSAPMSLFSYEKILIELLQDSKPYNGHIALALGRMGSTKAKKLIEKELGDGEFVGSWLYEEALICYGNDI